MNVSDHMMLNKWLTASATKFAHPDKQVQVVISRPVQQETLEVLLSGPEAEDAIRQLMQAYANALGKSLQICAYPDESGEVRLPWTTTGRGGRIGRTQRHHLASGPTKGDSHG